MISRLALAAILIVGLGLRLWGTSHGLPYAFNFDESLIVENALRFGAVGSAEPAFTAYPALFLYELFGIYGGYFLVGWLLGQFATPADVAVAFAADPTAFYLLGRLASVVAGTATVAATYVLGRRAFGSAVGLAAAALLAVAPTPVEQSHWALPDTTATLFATVAFVQCYGALRSGGYRAYIGAGLAAGLATSTMYNGGFLMLPIYLSHLLRRRDEGAGWKALLPDRRLVCAALAMVGGFFIASPYWLLRLPTYLDAFFYEISETLGGVVVGHAAAEGELPWLWVLRRIVEGDSTVGIAALLGLVWAIYRRRPADWLLALPCLGLIAFVGAWSMRHLEYLLPLYPPLSVLGARAVVEIAGRRPALLATVVGLMIALPVVQVARNDVALTLPDTRVIAKQWIEANVPSGTGVAFDWYHYSPPLVGFGENYIRYPGTQISYGSVVFVRPDALRLRLDAVLVDRPTYKLRALYPKTLAELRQEGVEYVMLSSYYLGRYFGPPPPASSPAWPIYDEERAYFETLLAPDNRDLRLVAEFEPDLGIGGPEIRVYRIEGTWPSRG